MKRNIIIIGLALVSMIPCKAQKIEVDQPVIDCGQIHYRMPETVEYGLKNSGDKPLIINDVKVGCGCTSVEILHKTIAPSQSGILKIKYDAKLLGHFNKYVAVYTNADPKPLILTIKGVVVHEIMDYSGEYPYKMGKIVAENNNIEFDDVNQGERPAAKIHIRNNSVEVLKPQVMHMPDYLKAEVSPSTVMPGKTGEITITLESSKLRNLGLTQTTVYVGAYPGDKVSEEKGVSVSAVLLPNFINYTEEQLRNAPQIALSADVVDFGSLLFKKHKKQTIEIYNNGKSVLNISDLQMFTSGMNVELNKTKLQPGEKAKMKIIAEKELLKAKKKNPRILMITNDPKRPKVLIKVQVK